MVRAQKAVGYKDLLAACFFNVLFISDSVNEELLLLPVSSHTFQYLLTAVVFILDYYY